MADAPITRPYQSAAVLAVREAWDAGHKRTLLVMATGTGKTWTFARILTQRRDEGRGRALVIAHRIELIEQGAAALEAAGLSVEIESGDRLASQHGSLLHGPSDVVIATVQSLRGKRLTRWSEMAFGTIVVDEVHHATAASYRNVIDRFPLAHLLGVTATPDRGDKVGLGGVIPHVAFQYELRQAIAEGYLSPIRCVSLSAAELDLKSIRITRQEHGRDLNPADIATQIEGAEAMHALAVQIVEVVGTRQTLIFTPTVLTAHKLADVLVSLTSTGVRACDGGSAKEDRSDAVTKFRESKIQFLLCCALWTEGADFPCTSAVIILRPTKSRSLFAQMIGRGTRLHPGKVDCLIADLTTNSDDHTLATPLDVLAGKPIPDDIRKLAQSAIADGATVDEALAKAEEIARKREELRQARRAKKAKTQFAARAKYEARDVDPFRDMRDSQGRRREPTREERAGVSLGRLVERLVDLGVAVPRGATREQCDSWMDSIARREAAGICTIKQARSLRKHGLRTDLTKAEARECFAVLTANDWKTSDHLRAKYGA
jgi:superfamily II DNA or RNA helicase